MEPEPEFENNLRENVTQDELGDILNTQESASNNTDNAIKDADLSSADQTTVIESIMTGNTDKLTGTVKNATNEEIGANRTTVKEVGKAIGFDFVDQPGADMSGRCGNSTGSPAEQAQNTKNISVFKNLSDYFAKMFEFGSGEEASNDLTKLNEKIEESKSKDPENTKRSNMLNVLKALLGLGGLIAGAIEAEKIIKALENALSGCYVMSSKLQTNRKLNCGDNNTNDALVSICGCPTADTSDFSSLSCDYNKAETCVSGYIYQYQKVTFADILAHVAQAIIDGPGELAGGLAGLITWLKNHSTLIIAIIAMGVLLPILLPVIKTVLPHKFGKKRKFKLK
jgi:hypothetical protein